MKRLLSKSWSWALTLVLGVAVWLFWRVGYPHALAYQEQFQLFLFGSDYFFSCMAEPGDLARWLGELLTQFYNNPVAGALVLALLFMLFYRLCVRLSGFIILSLVPAVLLCYTMGDESMLLAYTVALILSVAVCLAVRRMSLAVALGMSIVAMPLLYWLVGPMAMMVAVYMAVVLPLRPGSSRLSALGVGLLAVVMVVVSVVVSAHLVPYPLERLMAGISYYRFPLVLPLVFAGVPALVVFLGGMGLMGPMRLIGHIGPMSPISPISPAKAPLRALVYAGLLAAVVLLAVLLVPGGFERKRYELIDYDFLVRTGQWKAIISKAEQQQPDLPMSVSATNLALAMENQLGERAFWFYQRGTQGLVPSFERNFATTMLTGEIYFRLGMVNTAQRMAFEMMEGIPNYAKSVRAVKRLAETNLVNGQYDVARKYLKLLEKTLFYRKWAQQTMALLGDEARINAHPLYGHLRKVRLTEDFLFSEQEIDRICGQLFLHCEQNSMAMQYMLLWPLLQRDIPKFMQYAQVVEQHTLYNPRHIQEAFCYAFGQQQQRPPRQLVSDEMVSRQFLRFADAFNHGGRQNPALLQPFKNTVWYYLAAATPQSQNP